MPGFACSCGTHIPAKRPGVPGVQARWCSRDCWVRDDLVRQKVARSDVKRGRSCGGCSGPVPVARAANAVYCSELCKTRARRRQPLGNATCPCGSEFRMSRKDARFCSRACLSKSFRDNAARTCSVDGCDRPHRAKGMCNYCYRKARGEKGVWNDRRRDAYHRRRALKAQTSTGRPVILSEIRERDGNRCHLCRKAVPEKAWPHPLSASLDHVIPLSRGGIHDPDNVKLAHLRCNVEKGAGGGNEQLLLIG